MPLINTLDRPSEFDAASKLAEGEPYFLLIGRDALAQGLIMRWASYNRRRAIQKEDAGLITREEYETELRKSLDAEEIAWDMRSYKKRWKQRPRDEPRASATASYSGHQLPKETQERDALQRARNRVGAALQTAISEVAELQQLPGADGLGLSLLMAQLRAAAGTVVPPRPVLDR